MSLFSKQTFISHAGLSLSWKIDCDALTDEDIETLAFVISQRFNFSSVYGIPRGGVRLANALKQYTTIGPRLIVDDVLTTGKSMEEVYETGDVGVVIYARNRCPDWVLPIFTLVI